MLINPESLNYPHTQNYALSNAISQFSKDIKQSQSYVLLVEDNEINQKVETLMLNHLGIFNIDIANNGHEAIKLSTFNDYSFILLDIGLPEINGFKVCQYIRRNTRNCNVPIIAISAYQKEDIEDKCLISGVNYVLSKPISIDELKKTIIKITI